MTRVAVFIDFDGTISPVDISNTFFSRFAGRDAVDAVAEWKQGRISSRQCLERELAAYTGDIEDLRDFARRQPIDKGFSALERECRRRQAELFVVSDGLDFYIDAFLARHGVEVDVLSNRLLVKAGRRELAFPYYNPECGSCGNCKSSHIERAGRDSKYVIYVGDGLSDRCPVKKADLVFAKGDLRAYCREHDIPHIGFDNLAQVARHLESALTDTPLSKR